MEDQTITIEVEMRKGVAEALDNLATHEGIERDAYISQVLLRHILPYLSGRVDGIKDATSGALKAIDNVAKRVTV